MIRRNLEPVLRTALQDTPVVFLQGPRQSGKSTLAQSIASGHPSAEYMTLDDAVTLAAASRDPEAFVEALPGRVVLDEAQRVPGLLLAIKREVDRNRVPGRFLLTGSAGVLTLPRLSDSLVGRMELLTLWPFSQGEMAGHTESLVDRLFSGSVDPAEGPPTAAGPDLVDRVLTGGYPEAVTRKGPPRREAWFGSYLTTIMDRDIRALARIEGLGDLPRLLQILASRSAQLLNTSDLARSSGIPQTTFRRYLALLSGTFLHVTLPAWSTNVGKRFVRAPKGLVADSGLACSLLGMDRGRLSREPQQLGRLCEAFVAMEILKQLGWSKTRARLYHYRTHSGREVDLVLEGPGGSVVGIEVKTARTIGPHDIAGLEDLAEAAGNQFHRGVVLYLGDKAVPFAPRIHALPVHWLWS